MTPNHIALEWADYIHNEPRDENDIDNIEERSFFYFGAWAMESIFNQQSERFMAQGCDPNFMIPVLSAIENELEDFFARREGGERVLTTGNPRYIAQEWDRQEKSLPELFSYASSKADLVSSYYAGALSVLRVMVKLKRRKPDATAIDLANVFREVGQEIRIVLLALSNLK